MQVATTPLPPAPPAKSLDIVVNEIRTSPSKILLHMWIMFMSMRSLRRECPRQNGHLYAVF
jgi:hypothetical protein